LQLTERFLRAPHWPRQLRGYERVIRKHNAEL
jgi:hypothetical protein